MVGDLYLFHEFSNVWIEALIEACKYSPYNTEINYYFLSINPNLTLDIVLKLGIDKNWNFWGISRNRNVTWNMIKENMESENPIPWDASGLSRNPNITWENIKENMVSKNPINWNSHVGCNPNFTWENYKENMTFQNPIPMDPYYLSFNPNITWEHIKENLKSENPIKWNSKGLDLNPNITYENFIENMSLKNRIKWKSYAFPRDLNNIWTHSKLKWLSGSEGLTLDDELPLEFNHNFKIKLEDVKKEPSDYFYQSLRYYDEYNMVCSSLDITWEEVVKDVKSDEPFLKDYRILCWNPNLLWEYYIKRISDENYTFSKLFGGNLYLMGCKIESEKLLSLHDEITPYDVIFDICSNPNPINWNFSLLCANEMRNWKKRFMKERKSVRDAIKKELIEVTSQPGYFFRNVLCKEQIEELGFDHSIVEESALYTVILNHRKLISCACDFKLKESNDSAENL